MTTTTKRISARSILIPEGGDVAAGLQTKIDGLGATRDAGKAIARLGKGALSLLGDEIAQAAAGLLDVNIVDYVLGGLRKHATLIAAAERSSAALGSEEIVDLARHRIVVTHAPYVEVLVDDQARYRIDFEIRAQMVVTSVGAVVRDGELVAINSGACLATLTFTCQDKELGRGQMDIGAGMTGEIVPGIPLGCSGAHVSPLTVERPGNETLFDPWHLGGWQVVQGAQRAAPAT